MPQADVQLAQGFPAYDLPPPPYRLSIPLDTPRPSAATDDVAPDAPPKPTIVVEPYKALVAGPYPEDMPRMNPVRFTAMQVRHAIASLRRNAVVTRAIRPSRALHGRYTVVTRSLHGLHMCAQVEALRGAMNPGLTVVVGPPGTGKTDTAVQIISNVAHTFPQQRTLIITHSNQAWFELPHRYHAAHTTTHYALYYLLVQ